MRLLVTGSRTWDDTRPVYYMLHTAYAKAVREYDGKLTVVHGKAKGLDTIAAYWVTAHAKLGLNVAQEAHPVLGEDWRTKGMSAGHQRNATMVRHGADLGAAFIRADSNGTKGCMNMMRTAGISLAVVKWEERHDFWPTIDCGMCEVKVS